MGDGVSMPRTRLSRPKPSKRLPGQQLDAVASKGAGMRADSAFALQVRKTCQLVMNRAPTKRQNAVSSGWRSRARLDALAAPETATRRSICRRAVVAREESAADVDGRTNRYASCHVRKAGHADVMGTEPLRRSSRLRARQHSTDSKGRIRIILSTSSCEPQIEAGAGTSPSKRPHRSVPG